MNSLSISILGLWSLIILNFTVHQSFGEPRATEVALICGNRTAVPSDRQVYVANFLSAMESLTPQVSRQGYGVAINGTENNTVYAFGECMKDLSRRDCDLCFAQCKTQVLRCLPFQRLIKGGRLIFDGCYLRYDDYMFFNESLGSVDTTVCGDDEFSGNQTLFRANVLELVRNARVEGPKNDGFFTGLVSHGNLTVYGLGQCWEFVNGSDCMDCLENAASRLVSCSSKVEGRALNTGCYLRYSTTKFYNNSGIDDALGEGGESHRRAIIIASTCVAVACLLFIAMISLFVRRKILREKTAKKQLGPLLAVVNKSRINYSYESLERATNYFHDSNKLGQGGSGSVYKGILPGGQIVAVKRLFFSTKQWVDHFFNEVNLISGVEHTNLVKLLGCSVTGPESLLVYEYVPNQSLHDYFFVRKDVPKLGWEERLKIILGAAEGLAFLHEKSNLRIIHRDVKLSNILLDDDFTPKIADFGLARMFPEDQSHITTAVAGTLGYMAPEYIIRGKLTEKADVYSYGVVIVEVMTGVTNSTFLRNSNSILHKVWNLNRLGKLTEAIDPSMNGKCPEELASRVLRIGLLCVQASAELRPSMSAVATMLIGNEQIPEPTKPPFLSSSIAATPAAVSSPFLEANGAPVIGNSNTGSSGNEITESFLIPR
ncbi:cysteine-rich receptor-like protein kinase 3 isoform X2 [Andrographis paniculata]|uniref:cysteine-rich receptor-like protein kinase 3 isoform X2 n=1 Tax=Andrographis paniculata TaxID=175694 RepID=UPI0021E82FAB|nr:cysteine-rich receptor-like protein kinase 3 isoform X2 [Andrographis paniculata]